MVAYRGFGRVNVPATNSDQPTSVSSLQQSLTSATLTVSESSGTNRASASKMDQIKKHGLAGLTLKGKEKDRDKEKHVPKASPSPVLKFEKPRNTLDMLTESPPNMFLKGPQESTGALFSARLLLNIAEPQVIVETFELKLNVVVTTSKPVSKDCPNCVTKTTQLHKWDFLKGPKPLLSGEHEYPFSYLFPGHLPATAHGNIGVLKYFLDAQAKIKHVGPGAGDRKDDIITMRREIPVLRAKPETADRGHTRLFPPTNLAAYVTFPPVIHPIGDNTIHMRLNGCNDLDEKKGIVFRWRLRKLSWRLEEKEVMISPACSKHSEKVGGEGKGVQHEEVRPIGRGDTNEGWKTDMSDGTVEMELTCRPFANPRPQCDVDSPNGLRISHQLVVELVISEEWAKLKNLASATPTGSARVLRMTFPVEITERAGLGVAWDEETPPVYQDVPASPPVYPRKDPDLREASSPVEASRSGGEMIDYTGPPLGTPPAYDDELEGFRLGESRAAHIAGSSSGATPASPEVSSASPTSPGTAARMRGILNPQDFDTD